MSKEHSEEIQILLKKVVEHFDHEDRAVRERQIRMYKKLKYYWNGFQRLWWSEVAHDWRNFDNDQQSNDSSYYDKPVNVFRAYLESIIAALSVTIPAINCIPDDADNALDISTAKAGEQIYDLVSKHNDVSLLWLHALFIYCTEGMIACYTYPKADESYGTYDKNEYKDEEMDQEVKICPNCGMQMPESSELGEQLQDEFAPDDDDVIALDLLDKLGENVCPQCLIEVNPEIQIEKIVVKRLVGITKEPKTRICMEAYGGLYIKTATYAIKQSDTPYLIWSYETHYANVIERYPDLHDKFSNKPKMGSGSNDTYERWGRLSTQYYGEYPNNVYTVRNAWLRPAAFNILDKEETKKLKKLFPSGAKVVLVNDDYAEACNESLDDCWTLTHNPLSDYLQHDPLGLLLTSVQEITNDLIALIIQTIEHGIPQTFADPNVVDYVAYRQLEVSPGMIIPTKPSSGKSIGDAFYEVKTASLSAEVLPFAEKTQELGQLASGAFPSMFGGPSSGSKTAAEYSMSRAQALQRLQNSWKTLTFWWKNIWGKVIPLYIKEVTEDERLVKRDSAGNFINVFIRKAELQGKIGSIELEASEQLPTTWAQRKDVIMQLMQSNNPEIMSALSSPENITLLKEAIGLNDFIIPGEDDRQKQYEEIALLVKSAPIPHPEDGTDIPSIDIDPMIDDHKVESDICRRWLVSDAGRLAKIENPDGYRNVLLHMSRHVNIQQAMAAMQKSGKPPTASYSMKGEDLIDPLVRQGFETAIQSTGEDTPDKSNNIKGAADVRPNNNA